MSFFFQELVCLREVLAAEEAVVSREGRGVCGGQDGVLGGVYDAAFVLGVFSPEEEHDSFSIL